MHGQLRQLKDLACLKDVLFEHFALTGAAEGLTKVIDGLVDVGAFALR